MLSEVESVMTVKNFNLRVYGLLLQDDRVLITHEHRGGMPMTKFPGGGLEKGEGLADGLRREFMEELGLSVEAGDFFYVNDFLQVSAFNTADQLISFYYFVSADPIAVSAIPLRSEKHLLAPNEQVFEWVSLREIRRELFSFPIDQVVAEKLRSRH